MADTDLQITIRAVDQASAALAAVKNQLAQVQGAAAKAGTTAGADISRGISSGAQVATDALRRISPELGAIVSAAGPAAAALTAVFAGAKLFKEAWDLAAAGARAADVRQAFYDINGGARAATEGLEMLREASKGTINELTLMQSINTAKILGIDVSSEDMARLMALARERAKALGQTTDYMFDSLIRGLGRMSPLILDNLGIVIDQKRVYDEWAQSLGKTADKLTETEQKAALVNAVLEQAPADYGAGVATAAEQVDAMKAAMQDFRILLGESMKDMLGLADGARAVVVELNQILSQDVQADRLMAQYADAYERAVAQIEPKQVFINAAGEEQAMHSVALQAAELRQEMLRLADQVRDGNLTYDEAAKKMEALLGPFALIEMSAIDGAMGVAQMKIQLQEEAAAASEAARATAEAAAVFNRFYYEINNRGWANIEAAGGYPVSGPSEWAMGPGGTSLRPSEPVRWTYSPPKISGGGGGGGASSWETEMRRQATEMRSLVESILVPTEVTYADIAATKAGTYTAKWDEYGRRMRAIANDQQSVWRDMVPIDILNQGEEAIRSWAEQQEKAFYAGRLPEEVNWGEFVNRAREEIANKQAREALVQEALRQLQAAGLSIGATEAAELLGVGTPGAGVGSEVSSAFEAGLVATDTAAAVTRAFQEQMNAQQETWTLVGTLCISWFTIGLKQGITAETGRDIIDSLWPWLSERMNREAPLP